MVCCLQALPTIVSTTKNTKKDKTECSIAAPVAYLKMWYKNINGVGIRERGGKQVMSVAAKSWSKEQLMLLADNCIDQLCAGKDLLLVKAWCKNQITA